MWLWFFFWMKFFYYILIMKSIKKYKKKISSKRRTRKRINIKYFLGGASVSSKEKEKEKERVFFVTAHGSSPITTFELKEGYNVIYVCDLNKKILQKYQDQIYNRLYEDDFNLFKLYNFPDRDLSKYVGKTVVTDMTFSDGNITKSEGLIKTQAELEKYNLQYRISAGVKFKQLMGVIKFYPLPSMRKEQGFTKKISELIKFTNGVNDYSDINFKLHIGGKKEDNTEVLINDVDLYFNPQNLITHGIEDVREWGIVDIEHEEFDKKKSQEDNFLDCFQLVQEIMEEQGMDYNEPIKLSRLMYEIYKKPGTYLVHCCRKIDLDNISTEQMEAAREISNLPMIVESDFFKCDICGKKIVDSDKFKYREDTEQIVCDKHYCGICYSDNIIAKGVCKEHELFRERFNPSFFCPKYYTELIELFEINSPKMETLKKCLDVIIPQIQNKSKPVNKEMCIDMIKYIISVEDKVRREELKNTDESQENIFKIKFKLLNNIELYLKHYYKNYESYKEVEHLFYDFSKLATLLQVLKI